MVLSGLHNEVEQEEKKESDVMSVLAQLSPSKQRAKAAGSAGLSELSKQLRILQAKNEAQSVEINRLERQLRILADLQGISVADLRKALEDACANEAFGELQHRVAKLRAELEAAMLSKQREGQRETAAPHIANLELRIGELEEIEERHRREIQHLYDELGHERAKATRLEAESAQHKQDAQEYLDRLNKETARSNRLESSFQEQLKQHQMDQARKMQELAKLAKEASSRQLSDSHGQATSTDGGPGGTNNKRAGDDGSGTNRLKSVGRGSGGTETHNQPTSTAIVPAMAAEYERMVKLLNEKTEALKASEDRFRAEQEKWMKELREKDAQLRQAQMNHQVEKDEMALMIKALQEGDSQSELRLAQFKARFNVQDERITDMEQQLSSLYTAFGLIKEEQDVEDRKRAALEHNLNEADEEMARQVEHVEKQKSQRNLLGSPARGMTPNAVASTPASASTPTRIIDPWATTPQSQPGVPRTIRTPSVVPSTPVWASPTATAQRYVTPPPSVTARAYTPTPQRTPGTWELLFPEPESLNTRSFPSGGSREKDGLIIKGILLVKSKSVMRKWKSKFCKLYLQRNHYQWDMEGKSYTLGYGISKVEFNPNYPLSFTVHTNPFDEMAPIVHAAASTEEDYHRWMSALTTVTTGRDYEMPPLDGATRQSLVNTPVSRHSNQSSGSDSVVTGISAEEQEAADLQRALRLSQTII